MGIPPTIEVANLGMADSLILMVMALVVFGPRRLPQIGRQIGKLMYEFRKASNDFKFQMEEELRNAEEADRRKKEEAERQQQLAANPPAQIEGSVDPPVSESRPGAPAEAPEVSTSNDSGYPYNSTYGELAEAQETAETTSPTIQPPATGEPVPAAWPVSGEAEAGATTDVEAGSAEAAAVVPESDGALAVVAEEIPVEKENTVTETAAEEANKITEAAAHNG
jgi:sec-independent protein translocase protein TatB